MVGLARTSCAPGDRGSTEPVTPPLQTVFIVIALGDYFLTYYLLPMYFRADADAQMTRVMIRSFGLPVYKYIW